MDHFKLEKWTYNQEHHHFRRITEDKKISLLVFSAGTLPSGKWSKQWRIYLYEPGKKLDQAPDLKIAKLNDAFYKASVNQTGYLKILFLADLVLSDHGIELEDAFLIPEHIAVDEEE